MAPLFRLRLPRRRDRYRSGLPGTRHDRGAAAGRCPLRPAAKRATCAGHGRIVMTPYVIDRASNSRRRAVEEWLFGLDLVSPEVREKIVTAWVSTWSSSPYQELAEMPYSPGAPHYRLEWHVNDVTRAGVDLARRASADWGKVVDNDILLPILILHDVDKPLMYVRESPDK